MWNNLLAALILYTRLPFGRIKQVPHEAFSKATDFWPLVGFVTGGMLALGYALGLWLSGSLWMAALMALIFRLLGTGAFHEDGLADFFDGFGGGYNKERILAIMKDSHIGTYGVIALIIYFVMMLMSIHQLNPTSAMAVLWLADPLTKTISLSTIKVLPYARTAEQAKVGTVYTPPSGLRILLGLLPGVVALALFYWFGYAYIVWAVIPPLVLMSLLLVLMKHKIGGYTGDCCGASFLLCETAFYLGLIGVCNHLG